jgi:hypothetical protein
LQDQIVAISARQGRREFAAHSIRISAADMVALEQHLVATTNAHHFVAKCAEASIFISGSKEGEDCET